MHRTFQNGLFKLRLLTSRAYVKALTNSLVPTINSKNVSVSCRTNILGLGPVFRLNITLHNTSDTALRNLILSLSCNENFHKLSTPSVRVPVLVPSIDYQHFVHVTFIHHQMVSSALTITLCDADNVTLITEKALCPAPEPSF